MKTKITKGEWEVIRRPITHVTSKGHGLICEMIPGDGLGTIDANARLIAAAPDLYEALASCSETFDILLSDPDIEKNIVMVHEIRSRKSQVNKALSKAKGE